MNLAYEVFLSTAESNLKSIRKQCFMNLSNFLIKDNSSINNYKVLLLSMVDKTCFLIDGYIDCLKSKNLTVAGLIVRSLIDLCMRINGLSLVDEKNETAGQILSGIRFDKLKDKNGKFLKDGYLKIKLNELLDKTERVYDKSSGYTHFSNIAFSHSFVSLDGNTIKLQVGHIKETDEKYLIEGYDVMMFYTRFMNNILIPNLAEETE